jgi:hypothetical protein
VLNVPIKSAKNLGIALAALIAVLVSSPGCAGIYKCTDGAGRKTYSDKPCDGEIELVDPTRLGLNAASASKAGVPNATRANVLPHPSDLRAQPLPNETKAPAAR